MNLSPPVATAVNDTDREVQQSCSSMLYGKKKRTEAPLRAASPALGLQSLTVESDRDRTKKFDASRTKKDPDPN